MKEELSAVQVTTLFGVNNLQSIEAMKLIFFLKMEKFYVHFKNAKKNCRKVCSFGDKSVWTCCINLSQLGPEYIWLEVNVLPNNPKISDFSKKYVFYLNLSQINGRLGWKCGRADFVIVWDTWTRWLSKCILKRELSAIQVTTFFRANNFRNV